MTVFSGSCLCGAVSYRGKNAIGGGHCHCLDCRKSSGTGNCSHMGVREENLAVTGEVKFFESHADSGNLVGRGFCPSCGSPVYSKNSGMPGFIFVRASSLDDPEIFQPQMTVYASRALSWCPVNQHLPAFKEMAPVEAVEELLR